MALALFNLRRPWAGRRAGRLDRPGAGRCHPACHCHRADHRRADRQLYTIIDAYAIRLADNPFTFIVPGSSR
jgi:hypothetical protein